MTHCLLKCLLCVFSPCLSFMMWGDKLTDWLTWFYQFHSIAPRSRSCYFKLLPQSSVGYIRACAPPIPLGPPSSLACQDFHSERLRGATQAAQRCHTFLLTSTITTWNQSSAGSRQLLSSFSQQHCWLSGREDTSQRWLRGESSNWREILDFTQQA